MLGRLCVFLFWQSLVWGVTCEDVLGSGAAAEALMVQKKISSGCVGAVPSVEQLVCVARVSALEQEKERLRMREQLLISEIREMKEAIGRSVKQQEELVGMFKHCFQVQSSVGRWFGRPTVINARNITINVSRSVLQQDCAKTNHHMA